MSLLSSPIIQNILKLKLYFERLYNYYQTAACLIKFIFVFLIQFEINCAFIAVYVIFKGTRFHYFISLVFRNNSDKKRKKMKISITLVIHFHLKHIKT